MGRRGLHTDGPTPSPLPPPPKRPPHPHHPRAGDDELLTLGAAGPSDSAFELECPPGTFMFSVLGQATDVVNTVGGQCSDGSYLNEQGKQSTRAAGNRVRAGVQPAAGLGVVPVDLPRHGTAPRWDREGS